MAEAKVGDKIEVVRGCWTGKKGFIRIIGSERTVNPDSPFATDRKVYKCAPELIFGHDKPEEAAPFTVREDEFIILK